MTAVIESEQALSVTLDVSPSALVAAFTNAALFCGRDKMRPILCGASVEWTPRQVRVVATDSYRLLVQEIPRDHEDDAGHDVEGERLISRDDLIMFTKQLKACDKLFLGLRSFPCLAFGDGDVTVKTAFGSFTAKTAPFDYPNWRQLGSHEVQVPGVTGVSTLVNPAFLADIGKLHHLEVNKQASVCISPAVDHLKPFGFEVSHGGAGFRMYGLLMPVRA